MSVLDASALLAFLHDERGADVVERELETGPVIGAADWSETAQKVASRGGDWPLVRSLLGSYGVTVEPVTADDAETAAELWRAGSGLSLADRLCLALGRRLGTEMLTADTAWSEQPGVRQIR